MSINTPGDRRSAAGRKATKASFDQGYPVQDHPREVGRCRVVGVLGPQESDLEPDNVNQVGHIWAEVELPAQYRNARIRVIFGYTDHELYQLYGNSAALIGKRCKIVYTGSTPGEMQRGEVKFEPAYGQEQAHSASHTKVFNPVGPITGIDSADILKEIKALGESFEKIGPTS
jgi:hypothetical protein